MAELHAASNNDSSSGDNVVLVSDNVVGAEGNGELKKDKQAGEVNTEQKDTITETRDYSKDIYGRVPGKEPKYNIPCPSECRHNMKRGVSTSILMLIPTIFLLYIQSLNSLQKGTCNL